MLLVVDNGSVYTDSIAISLEDMSIPYKLLPCSSVAADDVRQYDSVILSGRRRNDAAMNAANSGIIRRCLRDARPLLGICYGAEILAITLGGTIRRMDAPRHGLREAVTIRDNPLCSGRISVFESHSYKVASLDPAFQAIASSDGCEFEAFQYGGMKMFGTQFHPEMSPDGRAILGNFARIA